MLKTKAIEIIRQLRDNYNSIAKDWDISRSKKPTNLKLKLVNEVVKPDNLVLDLGCGNGLMVPYVLGEKVKYVGVDNSTELLSIAKERYQNEIKEKQISFIEASVLDLPFKDNEFDTIISFAVLHHIPTEELHLNFLSELKRVLKPNGRARIIVWNLLNSWCDKRFEISEQLKNNKSNDVNVPWKGTEGNQFDRFLHVFNKKELVSLLEKVGFEKFEVDYYNRQGGLEENGEELVVKIN